MTKTFQRVGEIEMDNRRRAYFGKIGHEEHKRYVVEESEDGELHLIPLLPAMTHEEFDAQLREAVEQSRNEQTTYLGDFSQYADDEVNDDET